MLRYLVLIHVLLVILAYNTSCVNTKDAVYFQNITNGNLSIPNADFEVLLQKNDILSISISSLNPEASAVFNVQNETKVSTATPTGLSVQVSGYLIDNEGFIQLPIIGNIKAAGLTKKQLTNEIIRKINLEKLLIDPIVNIRHLNFKVTVLGEVGRPTVISVPNEKITMLEAIGLAGDITIFGKKENILVIREKPGAQKEITRINLNNEDLFKSEFYYLQPNDIVYVEPTKARVASASQSRVWLPMLLSGLSFAAIVVDRLTR